MREDRERNRAASKVRAEIKRSLGTAQNTRFDFALFLKRSGKGDHEGESPGVNLSKNKKLHENCNDWLTSVLECKIASSYKLQAKQQDLQTS